MPDRSSKKERISIIKAEAEKIFGDAEKAKRWLNRKNLALGSAPITMLVTEADTNEIRKVLNAIAYGEVV
jgi:uncharacterized protein (DUF2384 family)